MEIRPLGAEGAKDGQGKAAEFNNPYGVVAVGEALYIADTLNHAIRRIQ